jgi:hypothetical protein
MDLRKLRIACIALACAAALGISAAATVHAAPDALGLSVVSAGHGKVRLTVTAGPSGAPNGFEVWWMTSSEFAGYGGVWPPPWVVGEGWVDYTGVGTLHTWGMPSVDFKLAPNQSLDVEIGDTYDESGVSGTTAAELSDGTDYVFCAYAYGATPGDASPLSVTLDRATSAQGQNCTFTLGFWKTHAGSWPVTSLVLGNTTYSQAQLLQILNQPVVGNGLISLVHQLIAVKLNIANGADPSAVSATITAADAQIGALVVPPIGSDSLTPASTSNETQILDDYNNGVSGPGHCGATPGKTSTWGHLKTLYR